MRPSVLWRAISPTLALSLGAAAAAGCGSSAAGATLATGSPGRVRLALASTSVIDTGHVAAKIVNDTGRWVVWGGCLELIPSSGGLLPASECLSLWPIAPHSSITVHNVYVMTLVGSTIKAGVYRLVLPYRFANSGDAQPPKGPLRYIVTRLSIRRTS